MDVKRNRMTHAHSLAWWRQRGGSYTEFALMHMPPIVSRTFFASALDADIADIREKKLVCTVCSREYLHMQGGVERVRGEMSWGLS